MQLRIELVEWNTAWRNITYWVCECMVFCGWSTWDRFFSCEVIGFGTKV